MHVVLFSCRSYFHKLKSDLITACNTLVLLLLHTGQMYYMQTKTKRLKYSLEMLKSS